MNKVFLDLPKDVLSCILSFVICDYTALLCEESYNYGIDWLCCDDSSAHFQSWYDPLDWGPIFTAPKLIRCLVEMSLIHPKIRSLLKSHCVFIDRHWYFKRSFFLNIK